MDEYIYTSHISTTAQSVIISVLVINYLTGSIINGNYFEDLLQIIHKNVVFLMSHMD